MGVDSCNAELREQGSKQLVMPVATSLDFFPIGLYNGAMMPRMIAAFLILVSGWVGHCEKAQTNAPRLIIRCDDIGFCHGVNMAFKRIAEPGSVLYREYCVISPSHMAWHLQSHCGCRASGFRRPHALAGGAL
jgi:hypothetical protein